MELKKKRNLYRNTSRWATHWYSSHMVEL